ncbi:MAG TPA: hypothetical protein VHM19_23105 [Polyangiales bacterium]|jgi:hypothetical protein|nr:hypothetical protein [Polyangiales bacterium]
MSSATTYEPLDTDRDSGPWCPDCRGTGSVSGCRGSYETHDLCACSEIDGDEYGSDVTVHGVRCGCGETIECDTGRMRVRVVAGKVERTALCGACATEEQEPPDITPAGVAALHDRITALEAERDAARADLATERALCESMLPDVRKAVAERDEAVAIASAQSSRAATLIRELTAERDAAQAELEGITKRLAALLQRVADKPEAARRAS